MRIKKFLKPILSAALAVCMMGSLMTPLPAHALGNMPKTVRGGVKLAAGDFIFSGWNTKPDGSGVQYSDTDALNAIGKNTGVTDLTLYANWKTKITFDANGGTLSGGTTTDERALAGSSSGTIMMSRNASVSTGLSAQKTNSSFLRWNTKKDASGTWLDEYGKITKPVTFYAIYADVYDFSYDMTSTTPTDGGLYGHEEVYTIPYSGVYYLEAWGAKGGADGGQQGGYGGYSYGYVHLNAGEKLYINVGNACTWPYYIGLYVDGHGAQRGYNGGGVPTGKAACGGGATSIAKASGELASFQTAENAEKYVLLVAGGGGAGADTGTGGAGGGLAGESVGSAYGGTQTSGYAFGKGRNASGQTAGGGGGWYGGSSSNSSPGAGGSGYVNTSLGVYDGGMQVGVNNGTVYRWQVGGENRVVRHMVSTGRARISLYALD